MRGEEFRVLTLPSGDAHASPCRGLAGGSAFAHRKKLYGSIPLARIPLVVDVSWRRVGISRAPLVIVGKTYRYGCKVSVELTWLWGVLAMYEAEFATEDCRPVKLSHHHYISIERTQLTLLCRVQVIWPVSKTPQILRQSDARLELPVEDVALVHEQDELDLREKLIRAHGLPQQDRVLLRR